MKAANTKLSSSTQTKNKSSSPFFNSKNENANPFFSNNPPHSKPFFQSSPSKNETSFVQKKVKPDENDEQNVQMAPNNEFNDIQKELRESLKKKKTVEALNEYDIEYLLKQDFGKNILNDLAITMPSNANKIDALSAGALSFTLGMIKQRSDFIREYDDEKLKTLNNINNFTTNDSDLRRKNKKELIIYFAWHPDMNIVQKTASIAQIARISVDDSDLIVDLYDSKFQSNIIASIKTNAEPFFEKMKKLEWINLNNLSPEKVMLPDQFLAAVGESGPSAGIAGTKVFQPEPRRDPRKKESGVGIGYFMYSKDNPVQKDYHDMTVFIEKTIGVGFPDSGDLMIKISAYGFDLVDSGINYGKPLNAKPTLVKISIRKSEIAELEFHNNTSKINFTESQDIKTTQSEGSLILSIPAKYKPTDGGVTIKTETQLAYNIEGNTGEGYEGIKRARDVDEIQVQFSTNGKILENKIPEKTIDKNQDKYKTGQEFELKVYFDTDKAIIKPESEAVLKDFADILKSNPKLKFEIQGHTDSVASDEHNFKLSQDRAKAVVDNLVSKGIENSRLTPKGYGESDPDYDNKTEEGREKNRRVIAKVLEN